MIQGHKNIAKYPLNHVAYAHAQFNVATTKGYEEDAFSRNTLFYLDKVKVTVNVAQDPLHYVNYATSDGLGGGVFTRTYII